MTRKRKSTLPHSVQEQLNRIVAPCVTITLDARDLEIVTRYRAAKDAMREAINQALANQGPDLLWTAADTESVGLASDQLDVRQMEMCALLDIAVLKAGG